MKKRFTLYTPLIAFFLIGLSSLAQVQKGQDITGGSNENMGWAISMPDENTLAIGGDPEIASSFIEGVTRIYTWNGTTWAQKGSDIIGENPFNQSGFAVSMPDTNTIAIGAPYADDNLYSTLDFGYARVFKWNGNDWVQKGNTIDGLTSSDHCGSSVSMPDSNTLAVASPSNSSNGTSSGLVRIFKWNGITWAQKGNSILGEAAEDNAGTAVTMPDSNTLAIGAPYNNGNGTDAGHVRIFTWNGTAWVQKGNDINGEAADDHSGSSISMPDENTIAIDAEDNDADGTGTDKGHVRIYEWNGVDWVQKGNDINGQTSYDNLGTSVSMPSANMLAVGIPGHQLGYVSNSFRNGQVKLYSWNGSSWVQHGSNIEGQTSNTNLGSSVSMPSANIVGIGITNTNRAQVFDFCTPSFSTFSMNTCNSYTWIDGNTYTTSTNSAYHTLTGSTGCDSIVTLDLTITVPFTVTTDYLNATTLEGHIQGNYDHYEWVECMGTIYPSVAANASLTFTPEYNGAYALMVFNDSGCVDTSDCKTITVTGVETIEGEETFTLYPNPTTGNVTVALNQTYSTVSVSVRNTLGQETFAKDYHSTTTIDLELEGNAGIYFIQLKTDHQTHVLKVIKE